MAPKRAVLETLVRVRPRLAFAWADVEGRLAWRLGRCGPAANDVQRFFAVGPEEARSIAIRIASTRVRNRAFMRLAQMRGLEAARRLVQVDANNEVADRLRSGEPTIVVSLPMGCRVGIAVIFAGLSRSGVILADIHRGPWSRWGFELSAPRGGDAGGAVALKRAVDVLRDGGWVVAGLDGQAGPVDQRVDFLGGTLELRRGLGTLARLGGAPVYPVHALWTSGSRPIRGVVGPAIAESPAFDDSDAVDRAMVVRVAEAMAETVRATPGQCDTRFLEACVAAPGASSPEP
ncbi:MAG: hypothetical protein KJO07_10660 [Deltaproteobacteria bacterium]|nr:hypothetical protein [Deltaproteobacteria bacterium]